MSDTTLLVMAAGMGSRFGGLKQLTPLGPHGELLGYSVHDAANVGFKKAVINADDYYGRTVGKGDVQRCLIYQKF